jgi:hypothetical protein
MLLLPECLANFDPKLAALAGVDQSPISQCLSNSVHGVPCAPVTSHVIQGMDLHVTLV